MISPGESESPTPGVGSEGRRVRSLSKLCLVSQ